MPARRFLASTWRITLIAIAVIFLTGCFRYTPSRKEMEEEGDSKVAGPEAFASMQSESKKRRDQLLESRKYLLQPSAEQAYEIGIADVLKIEVFGFSDLSGETAVGEDGKINLPLIGFVDAAKSTVAGLQADLTTRFSKYVKNPKVRLSVNHFNAYRVSVVGSVVKPGMYPLKKSGYLLTELLAEAGGVRDNGANRIYLLPGKETSQTNGSSFAEQSPASLLADKAGIEIELDDLIGAIDKPPLLVPLVPGDQVVVPEAGQFRVGGEVENPGSFAVTRRTSALSAVAAAGGFTYAANVNEVEVIRDFGSGKKASVTVDLENVAFKGAPDIGLKDGDVVIVPSAEGRFRARQVVEAFRSVFRGGVSGSVRY